MKVWSALVLLKRALRGGPEGDRARYVFAEKLSRAIYPEYLFSEYGRTFLKDEEFLAYYRRFEPTNSHSLDRKFALDQLLKLVKDVPGDTAECGVFKGASSYLICRSIRGSDKTHHVFDSFEGLSPPSADDGPYWRAGDLSAAEEAVRASLAEFPFVSLHKGWIPERFDDVADRRFSFVHVDVDLHEPTRASLAFFYERMAPGGMILCDDYGFATCPGATKAMDEFFAHRPEEVVHLPTGQGLVLKR